MELVTCLVCGEVVTFVEGTTIRLCDCPVEKGISEVEWQRLEILENRRRG